MLRKMFLLCVLILIGTSVDAQTEAFVDSSFIAAVYEHDVILNPAPHVPLSRIQALQHLQKNLDIYEEQAAHAARQVRTIQDGRSHR